MVGEHNGPPQRMDTTGNHTSHIPTGQFISNSFCTTQGQGLQLPTFWVKARFNPGTASQEQQGSVLPGARNLKADDI
jgi:hypothetical protein